MINWILSFFEKNRVKSNSTLPFILFLTAKKYIQGHLMYLFEMLEKTLSNARVLNNEYKELLGKEIKCHQSKDVFGVITRFAQPLVTTDLLYYYKSKLRTETILIWFFAALEAAFFYMIAEILAGPLVDVFGENEKIRNFALMGISLLFGILCAYLLDKALSLFLNFQKALVYYKEQKVRKEVMNKYWFFVTMSAISILAFFGSLIYMNLARNFALHPTDGDAVHRAYNPYIGSCLVVVSIAIAIYIAIVKLELAEISPKIALYDEWLTIRKRMLQIQKEVEQLFTKFENNVNVEILSTLQMIRDLCETLGIEVDERDEDLLREFNANYIDGKDLTPELMDKYEHLITCKDRLVEYKMRNELYSNVSLTELTNIRNFINEQEQKFAERLTPPNPANIIDEGQIVNESDNQKNDNGETITNPNELNKAA